METQKPGSSSKVGDSSPGKPKKIGLEDLDIFGGPPPKPPVKQPEPVPFL